MNKDIRWAVAALLFWAAILFGTNFLSSVYPPLHPPPICQGDQPEKGPKQPCNEQAESLGAAFLDWIDADKVIAFFTVILGLGTIALVRDGREHSTRELRAYVGTQNTVVSVWPNTGNKPKFTYQVCNYGQTPASGLRIHAELKCLTLPIAESVFSFATLPQNERVVNPGQMFHVNSEADDPLTEAEVAAIAGLTARLYLWGRIEFVDAYGESRWATYRSYWDPAQNLMLADPKGNDAN